MSEMDELQIGAGTPDPFAKERTKMAKPQTFTYSLHDKDGAEKAIVTVCAPNVTGAEQNVVLLDEKLKPIAVLELQPGIDRRTL